MSDPKTTSAFPALHTIDGNWVRDPRPEHLGLTQYAEIAARFHAALICDGVTTSVEQKDLTAQEAFDHADAFFAELAKRTAP